VTSSSRMIRSRVRVRREASSESRFDSPPQRCWFPDWYLYLISFVCSWVTTVRLDIGYLDYTHCLALLGPISN